MKKLLLVAALAAMFPASVLAQTEPVGFRDTVEAQRGRWCGKGDDRWCNPADGSRLIGSIEFVVRDSEGNLKETRGLHNLVVDAGKAAVAGLIIATGHTNAFDHIAIGTGVTAAAAGDTACQTEITTNGGQRAVATLSRVTTDVTNDTSQAEVTYNFTGSFAVTESCFLDSLSAGVMLSRQVFSAINVASGDSLLIRWKIDVD